MTSKKKIRKNIISKIESIHKDELNQHSIKASSIFLKNINLKKNSIIAIYFPIGFEISTLPLLYSLYNYKICLPVISKKNSPMGFYEWSLGEILQKNKKYKIYEPLTSPKKELFPDIIIAPLVSFDTHGTRLGRGGGFYDLTINSMRSRNNSLIYLGYGLELQKFEKLPRDTHDQNLDMMITEKNFYKF